MAEMMVQVQDAVKRFKENVALSHVQVEFEKGKIHGIIGRNGSGKTVLFKCTCGFMALDEGSIFIEGKRVRPAAPQDTGTMSGLKNLKLLAQIRGIADESRIREVIRRVGLDPDDKKPVRKYSLGMRHRLGIAQAIMERPKLLLLDEPMNGLDKHGVLEIRELFKELREEGATILLSSHYVEDIDALCDTVYEMDHGVLTHLPGAERAPGES